MPESQGSKMTPQKWLNKVDWEGGILDAHIYGLRAIDLDDSDPEFTALAQSVETAIKAFLVAEAALTTYASDNYNY